MDCLKYYLLFFMSLYYQCCNSLDTSIINEKYNKKISLKVNNSLEYIVLFDNNVESNLSNYPARVTVISSNAQNEYPLIVTVRQQKEVLSWRLPLIVGADSNTKVFNRSARTLCPLISNNNTILQSLALRTLNNSITKLDLIETPIVTIATASEKVIDVDLIVKPKEDFYVVFSREYNTTITPSEPEFYFYAFNETLKYVVLEVNSDSNVCMTVSIQNSSCPVYDLNHDITFEGLWQTVDRKGGITITREKFPLGFFIVFVAKGDDSDCSDDVEIESSYRNHTKYVRFKVKSTITYDDYIIASVTTIVAIVCFSIIFGLTSCLCTLKGFRPRSMTFIEEDLIAATTPSTVTSIPDFADNISMDETEYDTIAEAETERELIFRKEVLYLSDLARKDPRILKRKSYLYLWHVLTVALFYGLPVVQLVITYQRQLNDTGNQDLCYYNFLCAHPLGMFSDFNHVFSNIGYILLGFLFLYLTRRREKFHQDLLFDRHFGIPQHYGLFYAMGVALIMEGILSGSYHICPNHSNFQFDSSFMYVIAVLCMVKIYQTRHPDINATAYATFGVLAAAIALGMFGILEANIYFWIGFTIMHIVVCLLLTAQIYYMGCWKFDRGMIMRFYMQYKAEFLSTGPVSMLKPIYTGRMVLLVIGNVCNWGLAVYGIYHHEKDFATYLLSIFMANTLLYFIFYIIMKLCHRERINLQAFMFLILTFSFAGTAYYFFVHKSISWALSPAQSRHFNQDCNKLLVFYDNHDIWHFLSAAAMFFSFMVLLTLDDDLSHTPRTKIHVF